MLVVAATQSDNRPNKGKDYEIARWEEEIRKSLAAKKATGVTLTKQQQALVHAQLEKESKIRQQVNLIASSLTRGLHFVQSIVNANVEEFQLYMSDLVSLMLSGALKRGSFLAGPLAFETYLVSYFFFYTSLRL